MRLRVALVRVEFRLNPALSERAATDAGLGMIADSE
jgi:hypothetical protein